MNGINSYGSNVPLGADSDPNAPWRQNPKKTETCTNCKGSGYVDPDTGESSDYINGILCPECLGEGIIILSDEGDDDD